MKEKLRKENYMFMLESFFIKMRVPYVIGVSLYLILVIITEYLFNRFAIPPEDQLFELFWWFPSAPFGGFIFLMGLKLIRDTAIISLNKIRVLISPNSWKKIKSLLVATFASRWQIIVSIPFGLLAFWLQFHYLFVEPYPWWEDFYAYNPNLNEIHAWFVVFQTGITYFFVAKCGYFVMMNIYILYLVGKGILVEKLNIWHPDRRCGLSGFAGYAYNISVVWLSGGLSLSLTLIAVARAQVLLAGYVVMQIIPFLLSLILFLVPLISYRNVILKLKDKEINELSKQSQKVNSIFRKFINRIKSTRNASHIDEIAKIRDAFDILKIQEERIEQISPWAAPTQLIATISLLIGDFLLKFFPTIIIEALSHLSSLIS